MPKEQMFFFSKTKPKSNLFRHILVEKDSEGKFHQIFIVQQTRTIDQNGK